MPRKLMVLGLAMLTLALVIPAFAADTTLSSNTGTASTLWFVSGEPSLVINGFDLEAFGLERPIQVESISISVRTAQPGQLVEAVVYEDQDGGSPQNATLLARKTVDIPAAGIFTAIFDVPVNVSRRFLWVGFYLPVDFEFRADTQGKSVLTYWGWKPGTTFDLNNLANATVFGPGDGSQPVNISMNGIARISANVITGGQTINQPVIASPQIQGDPTTNLSVLARYPVCAVLYDSADLIVTYQDGLDVDCKLVGDVLQPEEPANYRQRGPLYDLYAFGTSDGGLTPYKFPITHCIKPTAAQLETAVLGLAWGAPRKWEILPTVRFGDTICAEISYSGFLSIFTPR